MLKTYRTLVPYSRLNIFLTTSSALQTLQNCKTYCNKNIKHWFHKTLVLFFYMIYKYEKYIYISDTDKGHI